MKLTILVPSVEYKGWAGARIRYGRIRSALATLGIELTLEDIAAFDPLGADCDTVLISKCHDPRSLLVASILADRGKLVGIDLFDDYFSDASDSRLVRYRAWLADILPSCHFALCSTEAMKAVVKRYRPDVPAHVMNDPAEEHDVGRLAEVIREKLRAAGDGKRLQICWFGVGDNAFFPVGLADLAAYGAVLGDLSRGRRDVALNILTNARALGAEGLALISRLPVRTTITEWSEAAEARLLEEAFIAFLPVSAQGFSAAKSLNRAVTALSSGCQVLSVGYPLYDALGDLIYRDAETLLKDLDAGAMRLSAGRIADYADAMHALADADSEARKLAVFLAGLRRDAPTHSAPLAVVHGHATRADAHDLVRRAGGLSVASPFCSAVLDFDVLFRAQPFRLDMLVSRAASRRLLPDKAKQLQPRQKVGGREYFALQHESGAAAVRSDALEWHDQPLPVQLATYAPIMARLEQLMQESFGPIRTIVSETSRLPFQVDGGPR